MCDISEGPLRPDSISEEPMKPGSISEEPIKPGSISEDLPRPGSISEGLLRPGNSSLSSEPWLSEGELLLQKVIPTLSSPRIDDIPQEASSSEGEIKIGSSITGEQEKAAGEDLGNTSEREARGLEEGAMSGPGDYSGDVSASEGEVRPQGDRRRCYTLISSNLVHFQIHPAQRLAT